MKLATIRQRLYKIAGELEKQLRQLEESDNYKEDLFSDILIAKDKVIEAVQSLKSRD